MADVREMRIFAADQIEVHRDLPSILKNYSKEVIRSSPDNIVTFSKEYFQQILRDQGYFEQEQMKSTQKDFMNASEKAFVWHDRSVKINDHYKLMDSFTEGANSSLKKARVAIHKKTGLERAVIQKSFKQGSNERAELKRRMLDLVAKFDHPSILRFLEVFEDESNAYLVCECLKGENVIENLWKQGAVNEGQAARTI
jgi:serine/threonine protein kinase